MTKPNNETCDETCEMTDDKLDAVAGGIKWTDIFMPYKDFVRWPGGDPSPPRYA